MIESLRKKAGGLLLVAMLALPVFQFNGQNAQAASPAQESLPKQVVLANGFQITFDKVDYHADDTSTWFYTVEALPGAKNLSAWVLETPFCAPIRAAGPSEWETVDPDPHAHFSGVRWKTSGKFQRGQFWTRLDTTGQVGITHVAAKAAKTAVGEIAGPTCIETRPPAVPPADPPADPPGEPPVVPPADPPADPPAGPSDGEPPTITWVAPVKASGRHDMREGDSTQLVVTATDNVAVDHVRIIRWDAVSGAFVTIAVDRSPPYQASVSASALNPGWNQVSAASVDSQGNMSAWTLIWLYKIVDEPVFEEEPIKIFLPAVGR